MNTPFKPHSLTTGCSNAVLQNRSFNSNSPTTNRLSNTSPFTLFSTLILTFAPNFHETDLLKQLARDIGDGKSTVWYMSMTMCCFDLKSI